MHKNQRFEFTKKKHTHKTGYNSSAFEQNISAVKSILFKKIEHTALSATFRLFPSEMRVALLSYLMCGSNCQVTSCVKSRLYDDSCVLCVALNAIGANCDNGN